MKIEILKGRRLRSCFKSRTMRPHRSGNLAFTLIELLVVIAIIAILAGLLLPALARAKAKSTETLCRNNCKELTIGVLLYLNDNGDTFPACGSGTTYGFSVSDWIYWRNPPVTLPGSSTLATLNRSPVMMEMGTSSSSNVLMCPMDIDNAKRGIPNEGTIYPYSYEMNSLNLAAGDPVPLGFMTIVDSVNYPSPGTAFKFKSKDVVKPAQKIMCSETVTHLQTWDAPILDYTPAGGGLGWVAETGRFEPVAGGTLTDGQLTGTALNNFLTCRHGSGNNADSASAGQANVSFGDGHVAMVPWWYGTNLNYVNPSQ
jgi:prepilin-type N-terminal cleavage/methylation domain-containing protein/prepilin-type processing-associated H-X9-DG protein